MIKKPNKITVEAKGSIELEEVIKTDINALISPKVEELAKKYYRDIKVEVNVIVD